MMLFVIGIFFMVLSLIVGWSLKSAFEKYSRYPLSSGLSGREIAEKMLHDNGINDVRVMSVPGQLTDHYNPANKTVNLSPEVYGGRSISAAAVAAHECGHAVQHATAYRWLGFRSAMVPIVNISSTIMNFVFLASMMMGFVFHIFDNRMILAVIVVAQGFITLFSLVTLPVEFDATRRGLAWIETAGVASPPEMPKARHALRLAATTYVVNALYALTTLIYFILRFVGSDRR